MLNVQVVPQGVRDILHMIFYIYDTWYFYVRFYSIVVEVTTSSGLDCRAHLSAASAFAADDRVIVHLRSEAGDGVTPLHNGSKSTHPVVFEERLNQETRNTIYSITRQFRRGVPVSRSGLNSCARIIDCRKCLPMESGCVCSFISTRAGEREENTE